MWIEASTAHALEPKPPQSTPTPAGEQAAAASGLQRGEGVDEAVVELVVATRRDRHEVVVGQSVREPRGPPDPVQDVERGASADA